jgi:hypothetical protein
MTAKTMAEVLAEHRYRGGSEPRACRCGHELPLGLEGNLSDAIAAHQAAALSAAGFGLVADAKAEAWDEGWAARAWRDPVYRVPDTNPYRATP